jgi:hypothetical protein
MNQLSSKLGETKPESEWQDECAKFYKSIGMSPKWDTYVKLLELQQPGAEREWSGRKPVYTKTSNDLVAHRGEFGNE